ncbi:MAG TPA: HAD-IA family hydrolase [Candidatus Eisenbacteria bacterium]|nr:HAD-IA family hydrolase [Candidatus Eisenbacteria bacterium]
MTPSRPFDLVIFDCDGVLVDSERLINRIESRLFSQVGLDVSPDEARTAFKGRTVAEIVAIAESARGATLPAGWLYDWGMLIALGFVRDLRAVSGVRSVLDRLAAREIPTCVASQAPKVRVELALAVTDLERYFGARAFTASMVPRAKPLPDLFLYAAAAMGAEPSRCAVVEDSESGVRAAVAAGMTVFGYAADEDAEALARAGAAVFGTMAELPALLESGADAGARGNPPEAVVRLRDAYQAFAAGDRRSLGDLLSDDVVYHLPGRHLGGGTLRGRSEVFERTARAALSCDGPPAVRLRNVVGSGEHVLSIERFAARRRGRSVDQEVCVVWRMAGERCVEIWSAFSDQASCDRFWQDG